MPLTLDKVHFYQKVPGRNEVRLVKVQPYVRFVNKGEPAVLVQGGNFYSEGGDRYARKDVPGWVWDCAKKMKPEGRARVGLILPNEESPKVKGKKAESVPIPDTSDDTPSQEPEFAEDSEDKVRRIISGITGDEKIHGSED